MAEQSVQTPVQAPVEEAPAPARRKRTPKVFVEGSPPNMSFECGVTGHFVNKDGSVTLQIAICAKETSTKLYEGARSIRIRKVGEEVVAPEAAAVPSETA